MTTINLLVHDQQLLLTSEKPISAGDRETVSLAVEADGSWSDYRIRTIVWREGEGGAALLLEADSEGRYPIPPALTETPCLLAICISGESARGHIRTTTVVRYPILPGAPTEHTTVLADVSDGTATPAQVLAGATFYAAEGEMQTGIIPSYTDGETLTREIPCFDLSAAGLSALDFSGSLAYLTADFSALLGALRDTPVTLRFRLRYEEGSESTVVEAVPLIRLYDDGSAHAACYLPREDAETGRGLLDIACFRIGTDAVTGFALHIGGGNGKTSWQDLTDKPFGETEDGTVLPLDNKYLAILEASVRETDIFPETTADGFALDTSFGAYTPGYVVPAAFRLEEYEIYNVEWDGMFYTCNATAFELSGMRIVYIGNGASVGQAGNGEPFMITYNETANNSQLFAATAEASHTVRVYQTSSAERLREEYLPMEAIKTYIDDYISEALGGDY